MSCFESGEMLLPFVQVAKRIRQTWGIVIGAEPDDTALIREAGFGNLQEDDDIAANVAAFRERLEELQMVARLSDGEHRCAALFRWNRAFSLELRAGRTKFALFFHP
jgi:hypothetical protein